MPYGFTRTARKHALDTETVIEIACERLEAHDRELSRQGYDPQYIGVTEVKPVKCCGCGAPIPWAVLKGYAS